MMNSSSLQFLSRPHVLDQDTVMFLMLWYDIMFSQDWRQHREDCFEQPGAGDTDTDTIVLEDSAEDSADESRKSEEFQDETEAEQEDAEEAEAEKGQEGEGEDGEIDTRNGMDEEYEDLDVEKDWDHADEKMQVQVIDQQDDVEEEEEQGGLDAEKDWNQEDEMLDHDLDQQHDAEEEEEQEDVDAEKDWEHEDEEMQDEDLDQQNDVEEEEEQQDQNFPDMRRTSDSSDGEGVTDSGSESQ